MRKRDKVSEGDGDSGVSKNEEEGRVIENTGVRLGLGGFGQGSGLIRVCSCSFGQGVFGRGLWFGLLIKKKCFRQWDGSEEASMV